MRYVTAVALHRRHLAEVERTAPSLRHLGEQTVEPAVRLLVREGLPLTAAAEAATSLLTSLYRRSPAEQRRRPGTALRSMLDNTTIEMGLALYDLGHSFEGHAGRAARPHRRLRPCSCHRSPVKGTWGGALAVDAS